MKVLGTVRHIARYPVKSMRGEELRSASVGLQGLPGDGLCAFVWTGLRSTFPRLTGRELPALLRYQAAYEENRARPAPRGDGPGDSAYVSLMTAATLRALSEAAGVAVDHRRFRMNFVVDGEDPPFSEKEHQPQAVQLAPGLPGASRLLRNVRAAASRSRGSPSPVAPARAPSGGSADRR